MIFVGDLNCDSNNKRDKSAKILQDTISKFSFIDLWLNLNHQKNGNTWCDGQNVP